MTDLHAAQEWRPDSIFRSLSRSHTRALWRRSADRLRFKQDETRLPPTKTIG